MKFKLALLSAAAGLALAPSAFAYDFTYDAYEGFYGSVGAGYNTSDGGDERWIVGSTKFPTAPAFGSTEYNYEGGVGIYSALGYAWGNGFRSELEFSYRDHDIDTVKYFTAGGLSGTTETMALMLNTIYDIKTDTRVTPFLGAGIGFHRSDLTFNGSGPGGALALDQGDSGLAVQGIAGVGIELAENLSLDLSYRYLLTRDWKIEGGNSGAYLKADYDAHTLFAGLRWNFGAAPAPVVAPQYKSCWDGSEVLVTEACPEQITEVVDETPDDIEFTVYFDFNKSTLTDEAATLISNAAQQAIADDVDTVVVEGNTDRSGSSAYNQVLSQRRAEAVATALIANGVPGEKIVVRALGEDNPAQPTEDGVREPLNRRADVTISFE